MYVRRHEKRIISDFVGRDALEIVGEWNVAVVIFLVKYTHSCTHLIRFVCTFFTHWVAKKLRVTYIFIVLYHGLHSKYELRTYIISISVDNLLVENCCLAETVKNWWKPFQSYHVDAEIRCIIGKCCCQPFCMVCNVCARTMNSA